MIGMMEEGSEAPPPEDMPPPAAKGGGSELEMHATTIINAIKAGQASKLANALRNFNEACTGQDEEEGEEGGY